MEYGSKKAWKVFDNDKELKDTLIDEKNCEEVAEKFLSETKRWFEERGCVSFF